MARSLPFLLIGFLGGTIYHGTRSHWVWMAMDVLPIYILGIMTSYYHWRLIKISHKMIVLVFIVLFLLPNLILWTTLVHWPHRFTAGYLSLVIPCVLPMVLDQWRLGGKYLKSFLIPLVLILVSLLFRTLDSHPWVTMNFTIGTHWLWHLGGGLTCYFLLRHMESRSNH